MTFTSEEVARLAGVDNGTIRQWVRRGKIKPLRPGARPLRFTHDEVLRVCQAKGAHVPDLRPQMPADDLPVGFGEDRSVPLTVEDEPIGRMAAARSDAAANLTRHVGDLDDERGSEGARGEA